MKGRVLKCLSSSVIVENNNELTECSLRGKIKQASKSVLVGDFVEFDKEQKVVNMVLKRKNELIRPYVANVDQIIIVISEEPMADLMLVDEMIISSQMLKVPVSIVVNKSDINNPNFEEMIKRDYGKIVEKLLFASAKTQSGLIPLKKLLKGKLTVLVGQSGVGKSSLVNSLCEESNQLTDELSSKILRGKNTTRSNQIFKVKEGGEVIDSPGFSALSLGSIDPIKIKEEYLDFMKYSDVCEYRSCDHIHSQNCGIKNAVSKGKISQERYARYCSIFAKYSKMWENRYRRRQNSK